MKLAKLSSKSQGVIPLHMHAISRKNRYGLNQVWNFINIYTKFVEIITLKHQPIQSCPGLSQVDKSSIKNRIEEKIRKRM